MIAKIKDILETVGFYIVDNDTVLELDSIQFITIISEIETEFEVRFSNEDIKQLNHITFDGLVEIVTQKIK